MKQWAALRAIAVALSLCTARPRNRTLEAFLCASGIHKALVLGQSLQNGSINQSCSAPQNKNQATRVEAWYWEVSRRKLQEWMLQLAESYECLSLQWELENVGLHFEG